MKPLWILTISCVLMANAVNVNAIQAAAATPTPDSGCGANSAKGGCASDKPTGTKMHHKHGSKKSSKKAKKGAADTTPAPAASPSPK
jgi:hypothetical protein